MPVILWTDALIFVLVAMVLLFILRARRKEHLRAPWREVARSPLGMGTLVVLLTFIAIGLLDSLHFRVPLPDNPARPGQTEYSIEVQSLLDKLATPLRTNEEKTYSAPFATQLYVKETVERPDGSQVRVYPRLAYGGAHLENPGTDRNADIFRTSSKAVFEALLVWAIVVSLVIFALLAKQRKGQRKRPEGLDEPLKISDSSFPRTRESSAASVMDPRSREDDGSFKDGLNVKQEPSSFFFTLSAVFKGRTELPWRTILITSGIIIVLIALASELGVKYHIFGTDKVGQDVFYQTLKSIRTGLVIGTLTTLIMLPFAVLLGIMAGYFRGIIDDVVQYLYTTLSSIPGVLLIAASILILQVYMANHPEQFDTIAMRADVRLLFLCIILGITSWTGLCRLLRGETLKLRELDYIQAATAFGVGHFKIITRHILPNVMHIVLITVVLDFSGLVLAEAVLSYVGVGVDPSTISWGNMINSARLEMAREPMVWWPLLAAFVFMFTLVLAANLFSDVVRDAFDPRLRKL
ncbi:MAG: ABC transporter permease [Gammaproteobacteria bacterium]